MNSPPSRVARPAVQEAVAAGPDGNPKPGRIPVVNSVWNRLRKLRRRDAEYYVANGRAKWVDKDQSRLMLVESHPANIAAKNKAAAGYAWPDGKQLTPQELLNIGVVLPEKALKENIADRCVRGVRHFAGRSGPVTRPVSWPQGDAA